MTSRDGRKSLRHAAAVFTAAAALTGCYHATHMAATWSDPSARSLRFQHETLDCEWHQPVAVVNYPDETVPFQGPNRKT